MKVSSFVLILLSFNCYAQKTTPVIFEPGVISVGDYESHADFSVGGDISPRVTKDEKYFFFASARNINPATTSKRETMKEVEKRLHGAGNGLGDIWFVEVGVVVKER